MTIQDNGCFLQNYRIVRAIGTLFMQGSWSRAILNKVKEYASQIEIQHLSKDKPLLFKRNSPKTKRNKGAISGVIIMIDQQLQMCVYTYLLSTTDRLCLCKSTINHYCV